MFCRIYTRLADRNHGSGYRTRTREPDGSSFLIPEKVAMVSGMIKSADFWEERAGKKKIS